jgi:NAD(P)-dependent dehydrogenase (short-subunit alcohol dehydrogenase family)
MTEHEEQRGDQPGDTIIWITGATKGIGAGLVRQCPYRGATIINASRSEHPDLANVHLDLADPATWGNLRQSFREHLGGFTGKRALFIHNAIIEGATGFAGEMDEQRYRDEVIGNGAAPLVLADWFLREVGDGYESGIVLMSSAAARMALEAHSVYCAAKAGVEQWVRVVQLERARRGTGPWLVAVRPGFVDTPGLRLETTLDEHDYPIVNHIRQALDAGKALSPDIAARQIWDALPPAPDTPLLLFGAPPSGWVNERAEKRNA